MRQVILHSLNYFKASIRTEIMTFNHIKRTYDKVRKFYSIKVYRNT